MTSQKNHKYTEIVETLDNTIKEMDTMTYAQLNEILDVKLREAIGHRGIVCSDIKLVVKIRRQGGGCGHLLSSALI